MAYNTGNPIGSTSPKDLSDNAQDLDFLMLGGNPSYPDRKGVARKSWKGMEAEHIADLLRRATEFHVAQIDRYTQFTKFLESSGYESPVPYSLGMTLDRPTQSVTYMGNEYRVKNQFLPLTTTGWVTDEPKLKLIGDDSLRQSLASSTGSQEIGHQGGSLDGYLKGQQHMARSITYPASVVPLPKYRVLGTVADGSGMQSFPSVARYQGVDFVFFRSGNGHTGDDGVIKIHRISQETGVLIDTTLVLDLAYDTRDPCVLTDHHGQAVLVDGMMKIVVFHAAAGIANRVSVYSLNPANIAGGLINEVVVPGPAIAIRSDVKRLDDGSYGFVTYDFSSLYYVRTTDFVTFTSEFIGIDGNESALAEESDGTLVVVARGKTIAVVYKKPLGGAWARDFYIPIQLNAPTIRRLAYTLSNTTGSHAGWLLLARDNRDGGGVSAYDTGSSRLIALFSRNNGGLSISSFDIAQDVMGLPQVAASRIPYGDAFYTSAVTSKYGNGVTIYTHAPVYDDVFQTQSSYTTKIIRLSGKLNPGAGLYFEPASISNPKNLLINGSFDNDLHWLLPLPASISISGSKARFAGVTGIMEQTISLVPGVQYRLFIRARRVSGDGNSTNQHLKVLVRDTVVGADKVFVNARGTAAQFGDDFHVMRSQPFQVDTASTFVVRVLTYGDVGVETVSEVDWVYVGEASDLIDFVGGDNVERSITASDSAPSTVAGGILSVGYSSAFWSTFFGFVRVAGRPINYASPDDLRRSLRFINLTDGNGRPLMLRSFVINADYSITVKTELFPSDVAAGFVPLSPFTFMIESRFRAQ